MLAESFKAISDSKLSKQIGVIYPNISYPTIMKLLREKDIKVNGKRVSSDIDIVVGDEIVLYINEEMLEKKFDIVYEDDNIIVVFKYRKIEVTSPDASVETIESMLNEKHCECYAVHRIDMNTIGLVIFAKNEEAKALLDESFKTKTIDKIYLAIIFSSPYKQNDDMVAFLRKDPKYSIVKISDFQQSGYDRIETKYKVLKKYDDFSLVEVQIFTGKTHQIRAHFAHIGHPILGDEKYGNFKFNKKYKLKYQCLCSYKLTFHFENDSLLGYLNGKSIVADNEKIDFLNLCK